MSPEEENNWMNGQGRMGGMEDEIDDFLKILMDEHKSDQIVLDQNTKNTDMHFLCTNSLLGHKPLQLTSNNCDGAESPASSYGTLYSPPSSPESIRIQMNSSCNKNISINEPVVHIPSIMLGQDNDGSYKYDPRPLGRKKRRNLVPDEKKTIDYWERRKRNNQAARRSREERRLKELQTFHCMKLLQNENTSLKQTIQIMLRNQQQLQEEINMMKQVIDQSYKQRHGT
ncbi:thyrotroph embryonic factor [Hydra vulgaris]|uniref:thyrotroph embryonic factor n=1 Tax=Hydra vulgaris TaxID=6087 RepID=UPI0001925B27|nr:thyrotroph embryonic factor [Hydra vulgaris]